MTVYELMKILATFNPDAKVRLQDYSGTSDLTNEDIYQTEDKTIVVMTTDTIG